MITESGWYKVKIVANDYTPQEIAKLMREATDLTQKEFGKTISRSERSVRSLESGTRHLTVQTLLNIAKAHNFKVIITKEDKAEK